MTKLQLMLFLDRYFLVSHVGYSYYASKYSQSTLSVEEYNKYKEQLIKML